MKAERIIEISDKFVEAYRNEWLKDSHIKSMTTKKNVLAFMNRVNRIMDEEFFTKEDRDYVKSVNNSTLRVIIHLVLKGTINK